METGKAEFSAAMKEVLIEREKTLRQGSMINAYIGEVIGVRNTRVGQMLVVKNSRDDEEYLLLWPDAPPAIGSLGIIGQVNGTFGGLRWEFYPYKVNNASQG